MEPMKWDQYKAWVSDLAKLGGTYYCRGHADENWALKTSFHRVSQLTKISLIDYVDIIIPELQYYLCAHTNEIINLQDPLEYGAMLALLQHHGFPTPLLDWTISPYIAAYFAFREVNDTAPQSDNVKIYIFDHVNWSKQYNQTYDLRVPEAHVSIIRPYAKYNPRLIPQQGVFTVTNVDDMEKHILEASDRAKKNFLYTATLSVKEKPHVIKELNLMGINELSLFPSIDGICRMMKSRFFSMTAVGPTPSEWLANIKAESNIKSIPN